MTSCHVLDITVPYPLYGKVGYLLPQYNIQTLDSTFGDTVRLQLLIRADRASGFADALRELSAGTVVPELVEERFCDMD